MFKLVDIPLYAENKKKIKDLTKEIRETRRLLKDSQRNEDTKRPT